MNKNDPFVLVGSLVQHKKTKSSGTVIAFRGAQRATRVQVKWSDGLTTWVRKRDLK